MHNKSDLVDSLSESLGTSKVEAKRVLEQTLEVIKDAANDGGVRINEFGTFTVKDVPAREVRNPSTGEMVMKAASKKVKFKATPAFTGGAA